MVRAFVSMGCLPSSRVRCLTRMLSPGPVRAAMGLRSQTSCDRPRGDGRMAPPRVDAARRALHARQPRRDRRDRRRRLLRAAQRRDRRGDAATRASASAPTARLVEAAGLTRRHRARRPRARSQRLDDLVLGQVLGDSIVRVKLWTRDGHDPLLRRAARSSARATRSARRSASCSTTGGADAEVSDLDEPENRYERPQGKLLEAHTTIRTPDGTQLLFEIYQRFSSVQRERRAAARRARAAADRRAARARAASRCRSRGRWRGACSAGTREREALLASAVEASTQRAPPDRRRPARRRRAGPRGRRVRARAARRRRRSGAATTARPRRCARRPATLRQGVRDLRTLLVEIHPPNLESAGLRVGAERPAQPARRRAASRRALEVDGGARAAERADEQRRARLPRRARGDPQRARARRARSRCASRSRARRRASRGSS